MNAFLNRVISLYIMRRDRHVLGHQVINMLRSIHHIGQRNLHSQHVHGHSKRTRHLNIMQRVQRSLDTAGHRGRLIGNSQYRANRHRHPHTLLQRHHRVTNRQNGLRHIRHAVNLPTRIRVHRHRHKVQQLHLINTVILLRIRHTIHTQRRNGLRVTQVVRKIRTTIRLLIRQLRQRSTTNLHRSQGTVRPAPHLRLTTFNETHLMPPSNRRIRPYALQRPRINFHRLHITIKQHRSQHSSRLNTRTRLVLRPMHNSVFQQLPMRQLSRQATLNNNAPIRHVRVQRRFITRARHIVRQTFHLKARIPQFLTIGQQVNQVRAISQTRHTGLVPTNLRLLITMTRRITTSVVAPPTMTSIQHDDHRMQLRLRQLPHRSYITKRPSQVAIQTQTNVSQRHRQPTPIANKIRVVRIIRRPRQIGALLTNRTTLLPIRPPRVNTRNFRPVIRIRMHFRRSQANRVRLSQLTTHQIGTRIFNSFNVTIFGYSGTITQISIRHHTRSVLIRGTLRSLKIKRRFAIPHMTNPSKSVLQISVISRVPIRISSNHNRQRTFLLRTVSGLRVLNFHMPIMTTPPITRHRTQRRQHQTNRLMRILRNFSMPVTMSRSVRVLTKILTQGSPRAR